MKVSLICATVGRPQELARLYDSLVTQTYKNFELIVVDQSATDEVRLQLDAYSERMQTVHLRSPLGLSRARNVGLEAATGQIVCFPDDDCYYYPDTLERVQAAFAQGGVTLALGRIYDRAEKRNIIEDWPTEPRDCNEIEVYRYGGSICIYSTQVDMRMDERLGIGGPFPCSEDLDYSLRHLREGQGVRYFPDIDVWHPDLNVDVMPLEKVARYAYGVGGFYAKHRLYRIFILSVLRHLAYGAFGLVTLNRRLLRVSRTAVAQRWRGFTAWRAQERA